MDIMQVMGRLVCTQRVFFHVDAIESLSLLVIDEEHRFGVQQKEKIKQINPSIDILTMSATPIPRTLNMALSGMKQISTLTSAPKHRKPIITNINYFNDDLMLEGFDRLSCHCLVDNGEIVFSNYDGEEYNFAFCAFGSIPTSNLG